MIHCDENGIIAESNMHGFPIGMKVSETFQGSPVGRYMTHIFTTEDNSNKSVEDMFIGLLITEENIKRYKELKNKETQRKEVAMATKKLFENAQKSIEIDEQLTESQNKISDVLDGMKELLIDKNRKYGDSALHPNNVFFKGDATNSICIRLDDKLGRVKNSTELRKNDICDIIGYCTLLLVSKGATKNDILALKD